MPYLLFYIYDKCLAHSRPVNSFFKMESLKIVSVEQ